MASLWAIVILGNKTPFVVDLTSRSDLVFGDVVPIPTGPVAGKVFCAPVLIANTRVVARKNIVLFIKFNF
jgi:hypothetical protein